METEKQPILFLPKEDPYHVTRTIRNCIRLRISSIYDRLLPKKRNSAPGNTLLDGLSRKGHLKPLLV